MLIGSLRMMRVSYCTIHLCYELDFDRVQGYLKTISICSSQTSEVVLYVKFNFNVCPICKNCPS
ncbi:MAG: hypothetical protein IGNPGNKH_00075 [Sodalis sp. Ffu]|nr:MAG: hypothetical protein IGNPGNKH_00075 [Sodalis sp. Ffu]